MTDLNSRYAFQEKLAWFNEQLKPLDEVSALERKNKPDETAAAIARVGESVISQLKLLAEQRSIFVCEHLKFHTFVSADDPQSDIYKHLAAHLHGDEFGSVFSNRGVFTDSHQIISFAEDYLQKAYKGEMQLGQNMEATISGNRCTITFLPANTIADGVSVGPSSEGGRVVLKAEFEKPIGKNAVTVIEGKSFTIESRKMGGRDEQVNVVEGNAHETKIMYIIGGTYGHTGKFGLFTTFPGTYAPPMSDKEYWNKHGFYRN